MSWLLLRRLTAHQAIWGGAPPPPSGSFLTLEDGASYFLLEDGSSRVLTEVQ